MLLPRTSSVESRKARARRAGVSPAPDGRPRPAVGTESTRDCRARTRTAATQRYEVRVLFAFGNHRRARRPLSSSSLPFTPSGSAGVAPANDAVSHLIFDRAELSEQAFHAAILREETLPGPVYFVDDGILDHCSVNVRRAHGVPRCTSHESITPVRSNN